MIRNLILLLAVASFARADFSYVMTSKSSMGGNPSASKYYYKGNKMKMEMSNTAMIMDFDAQTITTLNPQDKSYTVKSFAEVNKEAAGAMTGVDVRPEVKETGQKKSINGFNASQLVMTMDVDSGRGGQKVQMEMETWISPDVPGVADLRAFYQRNMSKFPWASLGEGANPQMKAATVEMYRKLSQMGGAPVLQVMHMKMPGAGAGAPDPNSDPRMAQARAKLEEMAKQPGPAGQAAQQQLARMGGMAAASGGGMQITIEGSGYSGAPVSDSVFAIPGDYKKR